MEGEKVYTMSEAAKLLKVSRQTIYNKLDRPDLQEHIQDTEKGKVLSFAPETSTSIHCEMEAAPQAAAVGTSLLEQGDSPQKWHDPSADRCCEATSQALSISQWILVLQSHL